ncbi:MAG: beta-eliminating lyase-related protein, partial [Candidatus Liptonbacteria bacterium]|nr:beta-eliminating lyase-related protein [Candidatus Liptonbacteria bacterium]
EGGIRGVEIGSVMLGRDPRTKENRKAPRELLRLAIPRRVYSKEHLGWVIETFALLVSEKDMMRGVKFKYEAPILRHFSSTFSLS